MRPPIRLSHRVFVRMAAPPRPSAALRPGVLALLGLAALMLLARGASAQEALSIDEVQYDSSARTLTIDGQGVLETPPVIVVDGQEYEPNLVSVPSGVPADAGLAGTVMIAIEASSSTAVATGLLPIEEQAAIDLVNALPDGVAAGVVAFGTDATLVAAPSIDRDATVSAIESIEPTAYSAMRAGVALAANVLADRPGPGTLVILAYGWNFGDASVTASESAQAVADSGAEVHAFALGFDYDRAFLGSLAADSGGSLYRTVDAATLGAIAAGLEVQPVLWELTLRLPLTEGPHAVSVASGGRTAAATVVAPPAPAFTLAEGTPPSPGTRAFTIQGLPDGATVAASVAGHALPTPSPAGVVLDLWQFDPQPVDLVVTASLDGIELGTATQSIVIPALDPELTLEPVAGEDGRYRASARVQGAAAASLSVAIGGEEVDRIDVTSAGATLDVDAPPGSELTVALLDAAGLTLAQRSLETAPVATPAATAAAPAETPSATSPLAALIPVGVLVAFLGIAGLLIRRRLASEGPTPSGPRPGRTSRRQTGRARAVLASIRRVPRRGADVVGNAVDSVRSRLPARLRRGRRDTSPLDAARLVRAAERGELSLHFQPVFEASGRRVVGAEALLRWDDPEVGVSSARHFMSRAVSSGLLPELTGWVVRSACAFAREMQVSGYEGFRVTVNVSPGQLAGDGLVTAVRDALDVTELAAPYLEIEVSEISVLGHSEAVTAVLAQLASLGVRVSVDDFWAPGGSAEALDLPGVAAVKVDLWSNTGSEAARDQLATAVRMARQRGLTVVAKRVETVHEMGFFRDLGCELVQGNAFGAPMAADELRRRVDQIGATPRDRVQSDQADAAA